MATKKMTDLADAGGFTSDDKLIVLKNGTAVRSVAANSVINSVASSLATDTTLADALVTDASFIEQVASVVGGNEETAAYGIRFDTSVSDPACTRIGNLSLHKTLPVQSLMRGCTLGDDGNVIDYLPADDWTASVRDGSRGQVMVELPQHYAKFVEDGTVREVWLSLLPLPGYIKIPRRYVSAYEATVQRSTTTLCSVVNTDPDYRGGNNSTTYDAADFSFLGRPATSISLTNFRAYARKRGAVGQGGCGWNCYTYDVAKELFWLFAVEYATLNSQAAVNTALSSEGYRQGGLGAGATNLNSSNWSSFNGTNPFIPCGHTDSLGNGSGQVPYTMPSGYNSGSGLVVYANRYRGIENPFGHLYKWTDGGSVMISKEVADGGNGLSMAYVCSDPSLFNSTNVSGYSHVGNIARTSSSYVKEVLFGVGGEILPKVVGGSSTTFFCDSNYTSIPTGSNATELRGLLFGGNAGNGSAAGLVFVHSYNAPSPAKAGCGSRLCFYPA